MRSVSLLGLFLAFGCGGRAASVSGAGGASPVASAAGGGSAGSVAGATALPDPVVGLADAGTADSDAGTADGDAGTADSDAGTADSDAGTADSDAGTGVTLGLQRGATLADLDTPCGSVTGRDVLALLKASYGSTLVYESNRLLSSALTIQTAYEGGLITCAPRFCPCDPPPPPAKCQPCSEPPALYIDLATTFETADGSFNERFVGTAEYLPGNNDRIDIYGLIPGANFKGTFPKMFGADETFTFLITLSGSKTSGVVSETTTTRSAGGGNWGS